MKDKFLGRKIIIEDTTLRDGEQAPGFAFTKDMKIKVYKLLYDAGVRWFEVGIPVMGGEEEEALKEILTMKQDAVLVAWNRGVLEDVKKSLDLGYEAVHIGLPSSKIHISNSINKKSDWVLQRAKEVVEYAKDRGAFVSISAEDVGRAEIPFLQEYAGVVADAGADRLRLSDTVGILDFEQYGYIVGKVKEAADIDLQCHTHNDFGLALANTIQGLSAGATYFHATVNGIGERAGMPDIIQAAAIFKKIYHYDLGLNLEKLQKASEYVRKITNTSCFPWNPVIGSNVFAHESGIHVNGMIKNSNTFEVLQPEELGRERKYVLGKHSGRATIEYFLKQLNLEMTADELTICLEKVRQKSIDNLGEVTMTELKEMYTEIKNDQA